MSSSNSSSNMNGPVEPKSRKTNQNIQVYVRVRPTNQRERSIRSMEVVNVTSNREIVVQPMDSKMNKHFSFDRTFNTNSKQVEVYQTIVAPMIEEVLAGYNCTVFAYGQTGTGKTHTMIGEEIPQLGSQWEDETGVGIIPRALSHLFDDLRMMNVDFSMRISYLELYNEELCDLLSSDDSSRIRIFDDSTRKGSVIVQGLEEVPVQSKNDVYKLLAKGQERRKTAQTLMNDKSSRSHTVFSILVHIKENGIDGEELLKIGKLNLVDLAGSENISKAGNEKGIRTRETVNINQSLLTLGRVITALVERAPHVPYRESKLTRLLQESLGGRTKTSIIATISPGHKDIEETLSTLDYAHRAKNIQNRPEINQRLARKIVLKEYSEEIDRLKRDLIAAREKNGIFLAEDTYNDIQYKLECQNKEINEKTLKLKALKEEMDKKTDLFNEVSLTLVQRTEKLHKKEQEFKHTQQKLGDTRKVLSIAKKHINERDHLLESHVKTEKVLSAQANQLLSVAEVASNDTYSLQESIMRRKMAEQAIIDKFDHFNEQMQEQFSKIKNEYTAFAHSNIKLLDGANSDLDKEKTDHIGFFKNLNLTMNNLILKGAEVSAMIQKTLEENTNTIIKDVEKQKDEVIKNFSDMLKLETEKSANLVELIKKHILTQENRTTYCDEFYNQFITILNEHESKVGTMVNKDSIAWDQNLAIMNTLCTEANQKIESNMAEHAELNKEARNLIQGLLSILDKADETNKKNAMLTEKLSASRDQCKALVQNHLEEKQMIFNDVQVNVNSGKERIITAIQKNNEFNDYSKNTLNEFCENVNEIKNINSSTYTQMSATINEHSEEILTHVNTLNKQMLNLNGENEKMLDEYKNTTLPIVEEKEQLFGRFSTQLGADLKYLSDAINKNKGQHLQNISESSSMVSNFKQVEVKGYTPTGSTPSRRDFHYPKQLKCTSPHQQIIRRFRLENNYPEDLDSIQLNDSTEDSITSDESREDTFPVLMPNSTPLHPLQDLNPSNLNQNLLNDSEIRTYDFKALDNISQSETVEEFNKENKVYQ